MIRQDIKDSFGYNFDLVHRDGRVFNLTIYSSKLIEENLLINTFIKYVSYLELENENIMFYKDEVGYSLNFLRLEKPSKFTLGFFSKENCITEKHIISKILRREFVF